MYWNKTSAGSGKTCKKSAEGKGERQTRLEEQLGNIEYRSEISDMVVQ